MKRSWSVFKWLIRHEFVTETATYKVQRKITRTKKNNHRFCALHADSSLGLYFADSFFFLKIYLKVFFIELTQVCHRNCYLQRVITKNIYQRYMDLVFSKEFFNFSWRYIHCKRVSSYIADTSFWRTDRRRGGQTYGQTPVAKQCLLTPSWNALYLPWPIKSTAVMCCWA